jgi:hypothetical protein
MIDEVTIQSVIYGERKWQRVGERDHTTKDGRQYVRAVWQSTCIVCDGKFTVETAPDATSIEQSPAVSVMTCREHRLWPMESMKIWLAKPEDRGAVFEEIRHKKLTFVARPRVYDPRTWRRRPKRKRKLDD